MSITVTKTKDGKSRFKVRYLLKDGTQKYKTFDRKKDASKFEAQHRLAKRGHGITVDPITVTELWEKWDENHLQPNVAASTRQVYEYLWNAHVKPHLGSLPAQRLCDDPQILDAWYASRSQDVGNASLRKTMVVLSAVLNAGKRYRLIQFNPMDGMKKPSAKRTRVVRPPTVEQIWQTIELMPDDVSKILVGLIGFAGLRPGEALALEWGDVREKTLWIDKALTGLASEDPDQIEVGPTKTGATRAVPINPDLRRVLDLYAGAPRRGRLQDVLAPHRYKWWSRYVYKRLVGESLPEATRPYDLRHGYASRRIHEGVPLPLVALEMGHSQEMCLSTYSHVFAEATA